jgi:ABC-type Fe3+ transport system substrate-binding protein
MADAVILNIYKERGMEGLQRLAGNVKGFMHSSTMAKVAGASDPEGGAVFIIPVFFAESTRRSANVRVIWPEDGAAASPLYFLAKKDEQKRLSGLISFFTEGFAAIESALWFMPLGRTDLPGIPAGARLKWIGWDFIEANDVNGLRDQLNTSFRIMQQESR